MERHTMSLMWEDEHCQEASPLNYECPVTVLKIPVGYGSGKLANIIREKKCVGIAENYFSKVREAHLEPGGKGPSGSEDTMNSGFKDLHFSFLSRTCQGTPFRDSVKADEVKHRSTNTQIQVCACV